MYHAINSISPVHGGMINWNFFADKPPGGAGGSYDRVLSLLLGLEDTSTLDSVFTKWTNAL
jgi:hypothetical protein